MTTSTPKPRCDGCFWWQRIQRPLIGECHFNPPPAERRWGPVAAHAPVRLVRCSGERLNLRHPSRSERAQ